MKNKVAQVIRYIVLDCLAAEITWSVFFVFRKKFIEPRVLGMEVPLELDRNYFLGFAFMPLFWIMMGWMSGYYRDIYRKSRLRELGQTFFTSLLGSVILFFILFLDDVVDNYKAYYLSVLVYFSAHFLVTYIFRLILTSRTASLIQRKKIWFNTIIVGGNEKAVELVEMIQHEKRSSGNKLIGFIPPVAADHHPVEKYLPCLGPANKIKSLALMHKVEEVLIAVESTDHHVLQKLITDLDERNIRIKVIPDMYDILSGSVRFSSIFGTPLIEVSAVVMPQWQQSVKRAMDIIVSLLVLLVFSPVYLALAIVIRMDSKGPVLYSQERIGRWGKPFTIYKFRSMRTDAEKSGPALSSGQDNRMTRVGRWLRKFRLDELPQFYNVLAGNMSLVGPRPERQFFIDQIVVEAPHYRLLHRVKPGITSWGQVKFGYAENVKEMIERLKFDLLYIENMSLALDFKIIIYTVLTVLKAEGK